MHRRRGLNICCKIARRCDGKEKMFLPYFFSILFKQFDVCSSLHSKVAFEAFKACFQKVGKLNLVTQEKEFRSLFGMLQTTYYIMHTRRQQSLLPTQHSNYGILLQKMFWLTLRKNGSIYLEKLLKAQGWRSIICKIPKAVKK